MKLLYVYLHEAPRGMRLRSTTIEVGKSDWDVSVDGARIYLASKPGWKLGEPSVLNPKAPRVVFEIARNKADLVWECELGEMAPGESPADDSIGALGPAPRRRAPKTDTVA